MRSGQIRVLVVDDDQGDFEMIRVMLSRARRSDFRVDWVATFEEALDAFEAGDHDVYLVDYLLEDRTGLHLLREAGERGLRQPVIMLTGRAGLGVGVGALETGAAAYLTKGSIDPDDLEQAIDNALQGTRRSGDEEDDEPFLEGDAARFRAVFKDVSSGIALLGLDGTLLEVNPSFARSFSSTQRGMRALSYRELLAESEWKAIAEEMEAFRRGECSRTEADRAYLCPDGTIRWARAKTTLIRSQEGAPDQLLIVLEERD